MSRKIKIFLFVLLLILLGLFRETLFVNVNGVLYNKLYQTNEHTIIRFLSFISQFSYRSIYMAKWFITPFFAFIFWFVQRQFLWFLFHEKKAIKWLGVLYLSLFLLAGIFFVAGWAFGDLYSGYTFSRLFMGLLQSPVPCMILIPTVYLYKKTNINQPK